MALQKTKSSIEIKAGCIHNPGPMVINMDISNYHNEKYANS